MVSGDFSTDPGDYNTLLADFVAGTSAGTSVVTYRFYDINNTNDSACITLVYNVTPVGIAETAATMLGEPYPNPAGNSVTIPVLNSGDQVEVRLVNVLGEVVGSSLATSSDNAVRLDVAELSSGLYFALMVSNNEVIDRKRLVVE